MNTIAAIATAINNAGINIIRISGDESLRIIGEIFRPANKEKDITKVKSHTIHYGTIVDGDEDIDEVLVSVMKGPKSYTKEDVIEINCHGGAFVTKRILDLIVNHGAYIAEPGEFTKSSFLISLISS
ncbi:MAG: hypothetical protein K6G26_03820 [Lachnospiraceae bacterium]|nr:hypothetical protein [Lachnospiraceae bacterium]